MMRLFLVLAWTILSLLSSFTPPSSAQALGIAVAPATVALEDTLRGATYERMLYIMNPSEEAAEFTLDAEGYMAGWVQFFAPAADNAPLSRVAIAARERLGLVARFTIPGDVASGDYGGAIVVTRSGEEPSESGDDGVALSVQVRVPLMARVTGTQILTGEVRGVSIQEVEVNYPLRVALLFRNTGNVIARPTIRIDLLREGRQVTSGVFADQEVHTSMMEWIHCALDTPNLEPGDVLARLTVSLNDQVIAEHEEPVKLLPVGTLTRSGELLEITAGSEPRTGQVLKVIARFRNTGRIETLARFEGELHHADRLLASFHSRDVMVLPGQDALLVSYVELSEAGAYRISGVVAYGDKRSQVGELVLENALDVGQTDAAQAALSNETSLNPASQAPSGEPLDELDLLRQQQARWRLGLGVLAFSAAALVLWLVLRSRKLIRRGLM
ncbi:MAG: COG1470 family protein [Anaerolineae bacterium]